MKRIALLAVLVSCVAVSAQAAQTPQDVLVSISVPADAQVFMDRVEVATRRICGTETHTLYYRGCAEDVDAVMKASVSVAKKRDFRVQRKANPSAFSNRSYDIF